MSWIDIKVWIKEQEDRLRDSYIDNVFSMHNGIVFRLKKPEFGTFLLIMIPGKAIFSSSRLSFISSFFRTDNIAMGYRKYIRECRISNVTQIDNERIIVLNIKCRKDLTYKVIVELLPRGTIALIDESNKIKMTFKPLVAKDRVVKIGHIYSPPPKVLDPLSIEDSEVIRYITKGKDLIRGLIIGLNYPPEIVEEYLCMINIDKNVSIKDLYDESVIEIVRGLKEFIYKILDNPEPCVVLNSSDKNIVGAFPFRPKCSLADVNKYMYEEIDSFNDAIEKLVLNDIKREIHVADPEIRRMIINMEKIKGTIDKLKRDIENLAKLKSIIDYRYNDFESLFLNIKSSTKYRSFNLDKVKVEIRKDKVILSLDDYKYIMDPRKSFLENYIALSKNISSLERKIVNAEKELKQFRHRIREAEIAFREKMVIDNIKSRRIYEWYERFYWIITSEGLLAIGGINSDQNESIVRRYMSSNDIFIHADIHGAPVVVLKTDKAYTERSIIEASYISACYSKAWKSGYGSIDVFYVKASQVSKSPPPGEYLAKGSFMIYGKKSWIRSIPLRLGIGLEITGKKYPRIIAGPEDLIKSRSVVYSIIIPGDVDKESIAKKIISSWIDISSKKNIELYIRSIEFREVVKWIPGNSNIVENGKGDKINTAIEIDIDNLE